MLRFLLALVAAGGAGDAGAQVSPNGPEFQVNVYTTSQQRHPRLAANVLGQFVVSWVSDGSSGTDTSSSSIQARRYDVGGTPVAGEFQVNTYTTNTQWYPVVAVDGSGGFVIAWQSYGSSGSDSSGYAILAQRFDTDGTPLGDEFQVNTYTTGFQHHPAIAINSQGRFVVVWMSSGSSGTDTSATSIQARRFDAGGTPLGNESQVNTYTTLYQWDPRVAMDDQGRFIVVWQSDGSGGTDTDSTSIQAQRYDANGVRLGGESQVNTYTTHLQIRPAVAANAQGEFVVTWQSYGSDGTDSDRWSIQAQRFAADGTRFSGQFQVNSYTTGYQVYPAVATDDGGRFVIAWTSRGSDGTDTDAASVQAQRYDAIRYPLGGQFQVNSYTTSHQEFPAVVVDGQGNFVIAWESLGSSGTDSLGFSIQAQRYDELFRDGVESGDTGRWNVTVP